jgi:hypothetical protein
LIDLVDKEKARASGLFVLALRDTPKRLTDRLSIPGTQRNACAAMLSHAPGSSSLE